jgi:hypothetical protein
MSNWGALGRIALTVHLPLNAVNVHKVGPSDSDTFQDAGVPTVDIHSITQETFPILHSMQDRITAVKFDDYYDSYKLLAAASRISMANSTAGRLLHKPS